MSTQHGNNGVSTILSSKNISKYWFPVGKLVTVLYVKQVLGESGIGLTDEECASIKDKVESDRHQAHSWRKQKVEARVTTNAIKHGLDITNFSGLQEKWRKDGSLAMVAVMFHIVYGDFDDTPRWEFDLETIYMNHYGLSYYDVEKNQKEVKGCYAKLFTHCKNELVKNLNRVGFGSHGMLIRLK